MPPETTPAGATPAAAGATPAQTTPVSPAATAPAAPEKPATGEPDEALREPGKRALEKEREARQTAELLAADRAKRITELETASQTDQEKAIAQARKEASDEATGKYQAQVRQARVESALVAAGVEPSLLDLAAGAGEFAKLKVTDAGQVEGLAEAIAALKKDRPALFKTPVTTGTADGGTRGLPGLTREAIGKMTTNEINARWDEVQKALSQPA